MIFTKFIFYKVYIYIFKAQSLHKVNECVPLTKDM